MARTARTAMAWRRLMSKSPYCRARETYSWLDKAKGRSVSHTLQYVFAVGNPLLDGGRFEGAGTGGRDQPATRMTRYMPNADNAGQRLRFQFGWSARGRQGATAASAVRFGRGIACRGASSGVPY